MAIAEIIDPTKAWRGARQSAAFVAGTLVKAMVAGLTFIPGGRTANALAGSFRTTRQTPAAASRVSLGSRILVLVLLLLSISIGGDVYYSLERRASLQSDLNAQLRNSARLATLDMERTFEGARQLLTALSKVPAVRERALDRCGKLLSSIVADMPMYDYISVYDRDGLVLCSSNPTARAAGVSGELWQRQSTLASRGFVIGYYGQSKVKGNEVIRLSYPVTAYDGSVTSLISAGLSLKWLSGSIAEWRLPNDAVTDVTDRNGILIARYPETGAIGRSLPSGLLSALDTWEPGISKATDLDGVDRLFEYRTLDLGATGGILVAVGIDDKAAIAAIDRPLIRRLIIRLSMGIVVALLAMLYVRRFVERPIRRLLATAARWRDGDWFARTTLGGKIPEFARLGEAFDTMAEAVAAREATLQETAQSLRRSEEHLARAQRIATIGSWQLDFRTGVLHWSDEVFRLVGRSRESFVATQDSFLQLVLEEDRPRVQRAIAGNRSGQRSPPIEFRILRGDGAVRFFYRDAEPMLDAADEVIGMVGVLHDVTEKRESEARLQRQQAELAEALEAIRAVVENSPDVICTISDTSSLLSMNPAGILMLGYSSEELLGRVFLDFVHPDDRTRSQEVVANAMNGSAVAGFENRCIRKDGSIVHVLWSAVCPEPARIVFAIGHDLTAHLATEERLRQGQKMEALGNLIGGIAHDFNNVLAVVIGNLDLLCEEVGEDPEWLDLAAAARHAALRGAGITTTLLAFARKEPLQTHVFALNPLVRESCILLDRALGEDVAVQLDLADGLWPVSSDSGQIQTCLLNLCVNARDAMPNGGSVTIETRNVSLDADYAGQNPDAVAGDFVQLSVTDTGEGMTGDVLVHAFEPFFTTKEPGKGTGLGLSMVFGFIKQSGGHTKVYSEPGMGTCVKLYFPRAGSIAADVNAAPTDTAVMGNGECILVVEDDPQLRVLVLRQLTGLGYGTVAAGDARSALDMLKERKDIDLVFTDLVMPGGMSGVDLARQIRHQWPHMRVLLTSAFPNRMIVRMPQTPQDLKVLAKPYRLPDLAHAVRTVLTQNTADKE
jgi:PAS domain S-box-containing protein